MLGEDGRVDDEPGVVDDERDAVVAARRRKQRRSGATGHQGQSRLVEVATARIATILQVIAGWSEMGLIA